MRVRWSARCSTVAHALLISLLTTSIALVSGVPARAQIAFDDVTAAVGITHAGPSWGSAWGDFDGDGRPDLWAGNHNQWPPSLYLNGADGRFHDIALTVFTGRITGDRHGAAWADFDNDGDQDLIQIEGNSLGFVGPPNQFLINDNGTLVDQAVARGVAYPDPNPFTGNGSGMTPLWLDYDNDGDLDLIDSSTRPGVPSALFAQHNGTFTNVTAQTGFLTGINSRFAQITGFGSAGPPLLFVHSIQYPDHIYRYNTQPFVDMAAALGFGNRNTVVQDVAIADLNGDLKPDVLRIQKLTPPDLNQVGPTTVRANVQTESDEEGFSLRSDGSLNVGIAPVTFIFPGSIFIGASGAHPASNRFTLSPDDPSTVGIAPHTPGVDFGVFISRDPVEPVWTILLSRPGWLGLNFQVDANQPITDLAAINFSPSDGALPSSLFARVGQVFADRTVPAHLDVPTSCESVGAGDFDNDGDIDLFLVCTREASNLPDILLENTPNGFVPVPLAGGAAGTTLGHGDSVSVADYDGDGFLDLFVTNGGGNPSFNDGPDQLFHNRGNANHWIELDLEGVVANRDGIGSRVLVTAGGKTQVREQNGGTHRYSQNHSRIHFGLGSATVVDTLSIEWPDGVVQQVSALPADQLVRVVEPSTPTLYGQPTYQPGVDAGVYFWRDSSNGVYHLRASGGATASTFSVQLLASLPVKILGGIALESGDTVSGFGNGFALAAHVMNEEDGIDFQLTSGSAALLAVARDGRPSPRLLHVGATGAPLSPGGWIKDLSELPSPPPAFQAGSDLGLFLGANGTTLSARWSGNGAPTHAARLMLLASKPILGSTRVDLEASDVTAGTPFGVSVQSTFGSDSDGVDLQLRSGGPVGISYRQDGLFQSHRVNSKTRELGLPNATLILAP